MSATSPKISLRLLLPAMLVSQILGGATDASADNWPQWRGPQANGVAPAGNPPTTWSETSNIKWKVRIPGSGSSTPIVWENMVFIQTAVATGRRVETPAPIPTPVDTNAAAQPGRRGGRGGGRGEKPVEFNQYVLLCLDRQNGNVLWQKVAREEVPHEGFLVREGNPAPHSPVTDGAHVYAFFGSRGLYCYDMKGNLKWQKDLGDMRIRNTFGEGSSATLSGNKLVITWDHEDESFIVALNKENGDEIWRKPRRAITSWATPLVVEHQGKHQVVTGTTSKVQSYDLANGDLIWECTGLTQNVIPSPVTANGIVYAMSGYQGTALLAIRLDGKGDLTGTDSVVWRHTRSTPYVPSPLLYGNRLYFTAHNNGLLSCLDAKSGKPLIDAERLEAIPNIYASPVGAGGRVYLPGRNGATLVFKDADALEILATNKLEDAFDASPAVVGNELFLRGRENLYCIAEK